MFIQRLIALGRWYFKLHAMPQLVKIYAIKCLYLIGHCFGPRTAIQCGQRCAPCHNCEIFIVMIWLLLCLLLLLLGLLLGLLYRLRLACTPLRDFVRNIRS